MKLFLTALLVGVTVVTAYHAPSTVNRKRYDGYKVLEVNAVDKATLQYLHHLMLTDVNVDFWSEPSRTGRSVTLMVSPSHLRDVIEGLEQNNIKYSVFLEDFQELLSAEWADIDSRGEDYVFDINDFNSLTDIYDWLDVTALNCRANLTCQVYTVGRGFEGNEIKVFKISKAGAGRRSYWLDSGIHAREWIAHATNLKIINHLATGGDMDAVRLTDKYDWYIMPVLNPDGYAFSWTNDRQWRKNRADNNGSPCIGTDLNRNFNFRWGMEGVSHLPCSDEYCGSTGGSELETRAVSSEIRRLNTSLLATVTMHSYGEMWMFPWGNTVDHAGVTCERAADHADMNDVAVQAANAIQATYLTTWARGNSCEVIYETTGGSDDYAKGVAGVKYTFCPELRGNAFVIPKSNIDPSFREIWNGIVAMCNRISAKHDV